MTFMQRTFPAQRRSVVARALDCLPLCSFLCRDTETVPPSACSIKMYKAHFKKWSINKNLKLADAEALLLSLTKDVQRSGRSVSRQQVEVYFKRRKHYPQPPKTQSVGDIALAMEDTASLDPDATTAAVPPLPRVTLRPASDGHELVLRFVRRYLDINFSSHTWEIKPNAIRFGHKHLEGHDYFSSVFFRLFLEGRQALYNPHTRQKGGKLLNLAFARLRPALRLESGLLLRTAVRMITTQAQQEPHTVDLSKMLWRYVYDLGKVILGPTHPFLDCWKAAETRIVFTEQYGQLQLLLQFVAAESGRFAARLGRHDELFQAFAQCRADEIMGDDEYGLKNAEHRLRLLLDRLQKLPDDVPWKAHGEQRARVELAWNLHDQGMLTGSKEILDQSLLVAAPLPDLPYNYHRLLGWLELSHGRQREAEAAFKKALQLADAVEGPCSSTSLLMLADLKDCLQYFGGAKAELQAQKLDREVCHRRRAAAGTEGLATTGARAVIIAAATVETPVQTSTLATTRDVP